MHVFNGNRALNDQRDLPLDLPATLDPARANVAAQLAVPEPQPERRDWPLADAVWTGGGLGISGGRTQDCGLLGGDVDRRGDMSAGASAGAGAGVAAAGDMSAAGGGGGGGGGSGRGCGCGCSHGMHAGCLW